MSWAAVAALVVGVVVVGVMAGACGEGTPSDRAEEQNGRPVGLLPPVRSGAIEVTGALVAQPVLGERAALYFAVSNSGPDPDTIVAVDAAGLGTASLHRSGMEDGVMRMSPAGPVEIPASGRVELRPGGLHVMIEGLTETLVAGDTVIVTLRTRLSGSLSIPAIVVSYTDLLDYF